MKNKAKISLKKLALTVGILVVLIISTALIASATSTPIYHAGVNGLESPVAGRLPDCDVNPNGAYTATVQWFYQDGASFIHHTESEPLHAGEVYQAAVHLEAKGGYYFDTESRFFDCSINGVVRDDYKVISDTHVIVYHVYPTLSIAPVETVDITVDAPKMGNQPDFTAEITGNCTVEDYNDLGYVSGVFWIDTRTDKVLGQKDVFVAGRDYRVQIVLSPDADHTFTGADSKAIRINGKTAYFTRGYLGLSGEERVASLTFTAPEEIKELNVMGMQTPVVGKNPDFTASVDVDGVVIREIGWGVLKDVGGVEKVVDIDENYAFEDGETYLLCIKLENQTDKTFAMAVDNNAISGYAVNAMVGDKRATLAPWKEYDEHNVLQTRELHTYTELQIWYTCKLDVIETIDIRQLPTPVAGETPSPGSVWVAQEGLRIESISWGYIVNEGGYERVENMEPGETFKKGVSYNVTFRIRNVGDSVFNYDAVKKAHMMSATVNFKTASVATVFEHTGYEYVAVEPYNYVEVYTWIYCNTDTIDEVEISGVVAPVAGEKPSYDLAFQTGGYYSFGGDGILDGPHYAKSGVSWYDVTDDEYGVPVYENQPFIGGHRYKLKVTLFSNTNYWFAADKENNSLVTATVNGETANIFIRNTASSEIQVQYVFDCPIGIIDMVEIEIPDPIIGETPCYDKIVTDMYHSEDLGEAWEGLVSNNNGLFWFETDDSAIFLDPARGDVFKENTGYSLAICIMANEGYEFSKDLEVYINGYRLYNGVFALSTGAVIQNNYLITDCIHSIKPVAENPATCTENGFIAHYACDKCNQIFEDANGEILLDDGDDAAILPATGHTFTSYTPSERVDGAHIAKCGCGHDELQACIYEPQYIEGSSEYSKYNATVYICKCGNSGMVVVSTEDCDHMLSDWTCDDSAGVHCRSCACYAERVVEECEYEAEYVKAPNDYAERDVILYTCKVCDGHFVMPIEGITEPEEELTDNKTGVSVKVEEGSDAYIPAGAEIAVAPIEEDEVPEQAKKEMEKQLGGSIQSADGYDIAITYNGSELRMSGMVQVVVPYYSVNENPDVAVFYYNDLYVVPVKVVEYDYSGQYLVFETDHFSKYVIVTYTVREESGYLQNFLDAVANLSADASAEAKYAELSAAIELYAKLTDAEKAEASAAYAELSAAISAYNNKAESANKALADASELALAPVVVSFSFLSALWFILKKKFIV